MKTKTPVAEKVAREPRIDYRATNYSEAALAMMEKAIGQRFARATAPVKPATPQAADAE